MLQECRTLRIGGNGFCVLTAVEFDDEHFLKADEIENVITEWVLAARFAAIQLPQTQTLPQGALGVGRCIAQAALQAGAKHGMAGLAFHRVKCNDTSA